MVVVGWLVMKGGEGWDHRYGEIGTVPVCGQAGGVRKGAGVLVGPSIVGGAS